MIRNDKSKVLFLSITLALAIYPKVWATASATSCGEVKKIVGLAVILVQLALIQQQVR